ncbi:hypothetical protein K4L06_00940 [Lysobacter sp. BMK333-48F3]|uniref:DUF7919 family protein n=1 Tax=Lysobacter sp. BMK333-48F3 TaxID=2867962 RepID=UPI001C8B85AC|nr:hypothetical protein [Lysobacter sp. BMK333-48F3]MBX9399859.1 hypothetical protein [Lysobacter sp. BMK333-48F3]
MNLICAYEDLVPYGHMLGHFKFDDVVCIGWLDVRGPVPTGEVPSEFTEKLKRIACSDGPLKALVEPSRAPPSCPECGSLYIKCNDSYLPGAEIWIPGSGRIYSSPVAVIHYIEAHGYSPPKEYLDAVLSLDLKTDFLADAVYREKLLASGWFESKLTR